MNPLVVDLLGNGLADSTQQRFKAGFPQDSLPLKSIFTCINSMCMNCKQRMILSKSPYLLINDWEKLKQYLQKTLPNDYLHQVAQDSVSDCPIDII